MKTLFYPLVVILCSCSQSQLLKEQEKEIKYILSCKKFTVQESQNRYTIKVFNSDLKTDASKLLGSSVAALKLYNEFYSQNTEANVNTVFSVDYLGQDTSSYQYTLIQLAQAQSGEIMADQLLDSLIFNKLTQKIRIDKTDLDWNKIQGFGLLGFELTKVNMDDIRTDAVLFHYFIEPLNRALFIYYVPDLEKLILIKLI